MPTNLATVSTAAEITAGLVDRKHLAAECLPNRPVSERTVIRWEHSGLPVIKLGAARLYDLAKARAWVLTHEHRHDAPKRGRPTKARAA